MNEFLGGKIGLYPDIPFDDYAALDAINASLLKEFKRTPAHFKTAYDKKYVPKVDNTHREENPFFIGRAVHCAVLEPHRFGDEYVVADVLSRTAKAYKDLVRDSGKSVLTIPEHDMVKGIARSLEKDSHSQARTLLCQASYNELSAIWENEGIRCKGRADRYIEIADENLEDSQRRVIIDLKTTQDASFDAFQRSINMYGYHTSGAFYLDGFTKVTGKDHNRFIIIAVEKEEPYEVAVYEIEPSAIAKGRMIYEKYLGDYKMCRFMKQWNGYPDSVLPMGLPAYAY